ncbi:CoA transferase [Microbacterium sp. SA39]|uniref:CoA transferase n=1 Tax=Microbacterium sp. SA39 TaxID=1263625 RepID=UPI00061EE1D1|nr:CoA transferase [Microbacterium sp. SA39]KJQ55952.1 E-cinnamoyl-CoA:R-phenyllactate CoA transferase [Microbacterium sp. SA39]
MAAAPGHALLSRLRADLGQDEPPLLDIPQPTTPVPLPSRLATGDLAWASVATAVLAAGRHPSTIDPDRIAVAYRSDRVLSINGATPPVWSPLSGFWRTSDGWIRTHGNYPHHAAALRNGLELATTAGADEVRDAVAPRTSADAVHAILAAGGMAVPVLQEDPSADARLRQEPVLDIRRLDTAGTGTRRTPDADGLPLEGMRVLDLTRVIAGPVCTRTLALLGADVLRIDPPWLPEPEWQHLDTGHGKRSTLLDARSDRFRELLAEADAIILGYRPAAMDRLGLGIDALAERHPNLVIAHLSAWGAGAPDRAGFDSLVQAESGIAFVESRDGETPGALPAQALDHSAGYLLATAVTTLLRRRAIEGGTWSVRTSLRRVAAELLGMPRQPEPGAELTVDPASHTARFRVGESELETARPVIPGLEFAAPRSWGRDQPEW